MSGGGAGGGAGGAGTGGAGAVLAKRPLSRPSSLSLPQPSPQQQMALPRTGVEDMILLDDLTEGTILENLDTRYKSNLIYTYVGSILVCVNPYQPLAIYGDDLLRTYHTSRISELPPHIFAIADEAHYSMLKRRANQCVLISGESGAGKTESTKLLLQALTTLSQSHQWIEEQIIEANIVLEAFGNAKTVRNDNSSRFGKFVSIQFDHDGKVLGARIVNYLLEKSRVTNTPTNERNFHVFYQLLRGSTADEKANYALLPEASYNYLKDSIATPMSKELNDSKNFAHLKMSLQVVGFAELELKTVLVTLSAVLLLGNVTFANAETKGSEAAHVTVTSAADVLNTVASILGLDPIDLQKSLTMRVTTARNESISTPLTLEKALETRDALARGIYGGLFRWIVEQTNARIASGSANKGSAVPSSQPVGSIGVLDIFGFENFPTNAFEQFCINYANEQLQQYFNKFIFVNEQQEYEREGIVWSQVEFVDNQLCLELFTKKHTGLLAVIDEEAALANATDKSLLEKFHTNSQKHAHYRFVKTQATTQFGIAHYAGEVFYTVGGFLGRNRDALNPDVANLLVASKNKIISSIFMALVPSEPANPKTTKMTVRGLKKALHQIGVTAQFQESLDELLAMLDAAAPHFIRCIKPNEAKQPNNFDSKFVLTQLRYTGLLETVRIRKLGYSVRLQFPLFIDRFGLLERPRIRSSGVKAGDEASVIKSLLSSWAVPADSFQLGKTRVFLRTAAASQLELRRDQFLNLAALKIQAAYRSRHARRSFKQLRKSVLIVQSIVRLRNQRKKYLALRKAALKIKAILLARKQNKQYNLLRSATVVLQKYTRRFLCVKRFRKRRAHLLLVQIVLRTAIARKKLETLYYDRIQSDEAKRQRQIEADKFKQEMLERQRVAEKRAEEERLKQQQEQERLKQLQEQAAKADELGFPARVRMSSAGPQPALQAAVAAVITAPAAHSELKKALSATGLGAGATSGGTTPTTPTTEDGGQDGRRARRPMLFSEWDTAADFRRSMIPDMVYLRRVELACPDKPNPVKPLDKPKGDDMATRRTALARFTFAKYATAFFQARQVPTFSNESITKPLSAALAKRSDLTALAIDAFGYILTFIDSSELEENSGRNSPTTGPTSAGGLTVTPAALRRRVSENRQVVDIIRRLLALGIQHVDLRDEIYAQICKQTNGNPDPGSTVRGWFLMALCLHCFPPSASMESYLESYILHNGTFGFDAYNWTVLRLGSQSVHARLMVPSRLEIAAALCQSQMTIRVATAEGTLIPVSVGPYSTNQQVVLAVADQIGLRQLDGFGITVNGVSVGDNNSFIMDALSAVDADAKTSKAHNILTDIRLTKEYLALDEQFADPAALDIVSHQVIGVAKTGVCGLPLAIQSFAVLLFTESPNASGTENSSKLTKNHSPELAKLAQQFRSDLGNEDPATMIKQITALVETWKGKTANTIQAKLVKDAQSQPRLFSKVFAARQAHTSGSLRTYTRVFIAISRKQFFVTEGEITQASRWTGHGFNEITGMSTTPTQIDIQIGSSVVFKFESLLADVIQSAMFARIKLLAKTSNLAIALQGNKGGGSHDSPQLSYKRDDILVLTAPAEGAWLKGYVQTDAHKTSGIIPRETVHLLCGDFTSPSAAQFQISIDPLLSSSPTPVRASFSTSRRGAEEKEKDKATDKSLQQYASIHVRVQAGSIFGSFGRGSLRGTLRGTISKTFRRGRTGSNDLIDLDGSSSPTSSSAPGSQDASNAKSIVYCKDMITDPLHLDFTKEDDKKTAVLIFQTIQKIMGDYPSRKLPIELTLGLIERGRVLSAASDIWRDEILLQVLKQVNRNRSKMGLKKGWELFGSCLSFLSPTKRFEPTLVQYLQDNMNNKNESVCAGAQFALNLLKRISGRAVRRNHGPDTKELEAIQSFRPQLVKVYFPPGFSPAYKGLSLDSVATVKEALDQICDRMVIGNLANYAIYKVSNGQRHVLPGDLYVLDVVRDLALEAVASNLDPNNDRLCRLEFRKQVFQDIYTEENSTAVNNLIYVQSIESIKHMPLMIGVDEMVEIAALQLRLHSGDVVPKELSSVIQSFIPAQLYPQASQAEWENRCLKQYGLRVGIGRPDEIIRLINEAIAKSPYYGTEFFDVVQVYDPQIPSRVTVGINRLHIYLTDTARKTLLATYTYREVGAWSSNDERFAMKIGSMVGGQRFIADTTQGKDMTFLLETYVEALVQQQKTKPSNKALVSVGSRAYLPPQSPARTLKTMFGADATVEQQGGAAKPRSATLTVHDVLQQRATTSSGTSRSRRGSHISGESAAAAIAAVSSPLHAMAASLHDDDDDDDNE